MCHFERFVRFSEYCRGIPSPAIALPAAPAPEKPGSFLLAARAGRLTWLASYTYGKSMDLSSSIQEQVYPYGFRKEYGISAFDIKHNFVASYNYELPFEKLFRATNRLAQGWAISGITRFSTGLPVTFASFGDNALVYVQNNASIPLVLICLIFIPEPCKSTATLETAFHFSTRRCSPRMLWARLEHHPGDSSTDRASIILTSLSIRRRRSPKANRSNFVSKPSIHSIMRSFIRTALSTVISTAQPLEMC